MQYHSYETICNLIGGVRPYDLSLYMIALTHKSVLEHENQERMEHLGDSVLGLCVTTILYNKYPTADEGTLTQYKSKLVNGESLAEIGRRMGLYELIIIDPVVSAALNHDRVFEDTLESLIGAVYLDLGFESAFSFVRYILHNFVSLDEIEKDTNYKEMLRRYTMRKKIKQAIYETHINDNGDVECNVQINENGTTIAASAHGQHKKKAEMNAAYDLLKKIGFED